jgi:hypothetical protein
LCAYLECGRLWAYLDCGRLWALALVWSN